MHIGIAQELRVRPPLTMAIAALAEKDRSHITIELRWTLLLVSSSCAEQSSQVNQPQRGKHNTRRAAPRSCNPKAHRKEDLPAGAVAETLILTPQLFSIRQLFGSPGSLLDSITRPPPGVRARCFALKTRSERFQCLASVSGLNARRYTRRELNWTF